MSKEEKDETMGKVEEEIVSKEEAEKMKELRRRVQDLAEDNEYVQSNLSDQAMWRYLVAQSWDMEKSEKMFTESMKWRREVDMKRVMNMFENGEYADEEEERVAKLGHDLFYGHVIGETVEDAPLMVERLGKAAFGEISKDEKHLHAAKLAYAAYLEKAWLILAKHNKRQRGVIVVDLDGISMSLLWNISILKKVIHVGPLHYPEITKRVMIIRAPYFFTKLWEIVKRFVPKRTQHKIQVFGHSDYVEELAKITKGGLKTLPSYLLPDDDKAI